VYYMIIQGFWVVDGLLGIFNNYKKLKTGKNEFFEEKKL
jgi:hypothetical protein